MILTSMAADADKQHTTRPIVTGSSVIALRFKEGVIIAADTLCSYGGMLDFKEVKRIEQISANTVLASSGEFSDFQEVVLKLGKINKQALQYDDGVKPTPRDFGNYLARISYQMRCKINPYYLQNVVAGVNNGEQYLATVDLYGTYLEHKWVATGFASYFCKPIITNYWNENCTEQEAKNVLHECFKVLFCRDTKAHDVIQIAMIDQHGVRVENPVRINSQWDFRGFVNRANERLHTQ